MWNNCKDELKHSIESITHTKKIITGTKTIMMAMNLVRFAPRLMKVTILNKNQVALLDSLSIELFLTISQLTTNTILK